ncbi:minor tail protein L [Achromobacter phage JWF]|uniref:minor tail protein n=1 Tax=Achromobacter phage JWF TaxID=1589748 RepID=UPI000588E6D0|nr:minor tail protein [Achromobacter phage JWF]AJD82916.1 minor tail protein L [Achromobacter phage JWF]
MRNNLPSTHVKDAFELTPESQVDLIMIELNLNGGGQIICITSRQEFTWQGRKYEFLPNAIAGEGVSTQGEAKRPKFTVANPDGAFSAFVAQGKMDGATITRYRVSLADITNNINRFQMNRWRVSKVASMTKSMLTFELRSPLDGQFFLLPAEAFYPPEYPHVSLQ